MGPLGHFSKNSRVLRMPRSGAGPNELGIRWAGRVLGGELSVQEALHLAELRTPRSISAEGPQGKAYPEGQDPVLRAHMEKGGRS